MPRPRGPASTHRKMCNHGALIRRNTRDQTGHIYHGHWWPPRFLCKQSCHGNERNHNGPQTVTAEEQPFLTSGMTGIGDASRSVRKIFESRSGLSTFPAGMESTCTLRITKRGLSTPDLGVAFVVGAWREGEGIGVAGLKDAQAVTTQMVSLHGISEDKLSRIRFDEQLLSMDVLGRHRNRLRKVSSCRQHVSPESTRCFFTRGNHGS